MTAVDIVNEFITETSTLQDQIHKLNNRLVPAFRLGNKDLSEFKKVADMLKLSSDKLQEAFEQLDQEKENNES